MQGAATQSMWGHRPGGVTGLTRRSEGSAGEWHSTYPVCRSAHSDNGPIFVGTADVEATGWSRNLQGLTQRDLPGPARAVGRRTKGRKPMVRQESEDCTVPKASGNRSRTRIARKTGGGKAVPVKEEGRQRKLNFVTAESPGGGGGGAEGKRDGDGSPSRVQKVAKAKSNLKGVGPARMEEVVERLEEAFEKVAANQGAPGPDRQSTGRVREHLPELLPVLRASLLDGSYRPGDIRRVWIPKGGGGAGGVGGPNVVDRMGREAVGGVL